MPELDAEHLNRSKSRRPSLGVSGRATLLILTLVCAAFVASSSYIYVTQSASIRADLNASMAKFSTASAARVANWLRGKIDITLMLAQDMGTAGTTAAPERLFDLPVVRESFPIRYIGRTDGSFTQIPYESLPADYDPRTRAWYKGAAEAKGPFVTEPYRKANTGALIISAAAPVVDVKGNLLGVVGANIDLSTLDRRLGNTGSTGRAYSYLV
ncbi:cache domain-containing protein, partial [Methylobacterium sp. 1030]|uniref:PDC sensor domain-containing protein n=1 Tax=Methylobacterium sp. 1030 TaxID=3156404 RepID=UPI00339B9D44